MRIRCYIPPDRWIGQILSVSGREAHHLIHVLRVSPGMSVTCFDGNGNEATAVVRQVTRREVFLELKSQKSIPSVKCPITFGISVPGHGKLDEIINHLTQLGVAAIIPLSTARGLVKISAAEFGRKQNRLSKIIVEAGKQCGVSRLPVLKPLTPWDRLLPSFKEYDLVLIATVEGPYENPAALLSVRDCGSILLLIGPEGDFTPEEIHQAVQAGAHRISLGPTILRCETAAIAAVSVISFLLREGQVDSHRKKR